ncbi:MAG: aminoacyl-tRNA deacylase [Solirubrobacteraceae bacterium]
MTHEHNPEQGMHGIEAVAHFLRRMQAPYQLIEHQDTFAAVDEARATGSALERTAKTVLLHDHGVFRAAVIPASERLELHKARMLLRASGHLRLASEDEIERSSPCSTPARCRHSAPCSECRRSWTSGCSATTTFSAAAAVTATRSRSPPARSSGSATHS